MKGIKFIIIIILVNGVISSCYYDNREELYPYLNTNCDTLNITFNNSIKPILQTNCLGCHGTSSAAVSGDNQRLENYSDVRLVGENGKLFGAINHEAGYPSMPKNSGKLDDCSILIINKWIESGFPE